jgi:hypothetical protein
VFQKQHRAQAAYAYDLIGGILQISEVPHEKMILLVENMFTEIGNSNIVGDNQRRAGQEMKCTD